MVEGLIRSRLQAEGLEDQVTVSSVGVFASTGEPADRQMVALLAARGIDVGGHRGRALTVSDLVAADLIVVMEEAHRQAIFYRQPHLLYKVYLLSELAGEHDDLPDPHGGPEAGYQAVLGEAERWLVAGWGRLVKLVER